MSGIFSAHIFNPAIFNTDEDTGPTPSGEPPDATAESLVPQGVASTVVPQGTATNLTPSGTGV